MTREEKEYLSRVAVDALIESDNHLMTSRDNAEFSQWVEDLIDNYCEADAESKESMLTREQNVRAIIETHFAGFKEEIIDSAVNRILELKDEPNQRRIVDKERNKCRSMFGS